MVRCQFKNPYKLRMPVQQRTLCALRVFVELCCLSLMNRSYWEDLVTSPTFSTLSELNQKFILEKMLGPSPAETVSISGDVSFKGVILEVVSMEASTHMPMMLRSPRSKPTPMKETQTFKPKMDK